VSFWAIPQGGQSTKFKRFTVKPSANPSSPSLKKIALTGGAIFRIVGEFRRRSKSQEKDKLRTQSNQWDTL
jgi:hypothetical protein